MYDHAKIKSPVASVEPCAVPHAARHSGPALVNTTLVSRPISAKKRGFSILLAPLALLLFVLFSDPAVSDEDTSSVVTEKFRYETRGAFTSSERDLIKNAMVIVADRFMDTDIVDNLEKITNNGCLTDIGLDSLSVLGSEVDVNSALKHQLRAIKEARPSEVPPILIHSYHEESLAHGNANMDTIAITRSEDGEVVIYGYFEIRLNQHNLAKNTDPRHWAGTIAHEMLHNLGHGHNCHKPDTIPVTSDLYQINAFANAIRHNGAYRPGGDVQLDIDCERDGAFCISTRADREFYFTNECQQAVNIAVRFSDQLGGWHLRHWWRFEPNTSGYLYDQEAGDRIRSANSVWYYYAKIVDGPDSDWEGTHAVPFAGETLLMKEMRVIRSTDNEWTFSCDE